MDIELGKAPLEMKNIWSGLVQKPKGWKARSTNVHPTAEPTSQSQPIQHTDHISHSILSMWVQLRNRQTVEFGTPSFAAYSAITLSL